MSVVALLSSVLDAGSSPAISTFRRFCLIRLSPKSPEKSGLFVFLAYSELNVGSNRRKGGGIRSVPLPDEIAIIPD